MFWMVNSRCTQGLYLCPLNPSTNEDTWSTEGCEPLNLPMDAAPLAACMQGRVD